MHSHLTLGIDPGPTHTGWVVINTDTRRPIHHGKDPNDDLLGWLGDDHTFTDVAQAAVEMVASYGMAVGADVFETCVWIGRYVEALRRLRVPTRLVYRREVKLHHCNSARARDSNIRQALLDRFTPGQPNSGKGTKTNPGWFHGFKADVWQAYALAVHHADHTTNTLTANTTHPDGSVQTRVIPLGRGGVA